MIEIPEDVEQWDLGLLVNLLHQGFDESKILEFKSAINDGGTSISKTVCAFANTDGGFLVIGINNDRSQKLTLDQRLIGLDDSDDLKSRITALIKNITPDLLVNNTIFRNSNIKLENGKVIIILKVLKSRNKPHQFEYKFFKRVPNGNEPMDVNEVKQIILESQKQKRNEILMIRELSLTKKALKYIKEELTPEDVFLEGWAGLSYQDLTSTIYFQHNLAYAYPMKISSTLSDLIHNVNRLSDIPQGLRPVNDKFIPTIIEEAKKQGYTEPKKYAKDLIMTRINYALNDIEEISKLLNRDLLDTFNLEPKK